MAVWPANATWTAAFVCCLWVPVTYVSDSNIYLWQIFEMNAVTQLSICMLLTQSDLLQDEQVALGLQENNTKLIVKNNTNTMMKEKKPTLASSMRQCMMSMLSHASSTQHGPADVPCYLEGKRHAKCMQLSQNNAESDDPTSLPTGCGLHSCSSTFHINKAAETLSVGLCHCKCAYYADTVH